MLELKSLQERPKRRPRAPRGRPETPRQRREAPSERQEVPGRGQERFRSHWGSIWDPPWEAQNHQKPLKKHGVFKIFAIFQGGFKKRPTKLQKETPGRPKWPTSAQERPKRRQDSPRSRQKRPRSAPRAAQEANKRSKKGYHLRFRSWGGSGRPPGAILKRFGSDFRDSGVAF